MFPVACQQARSRTPVDRHESLCNAGTAAGGFHFGVAGKEGMAMKVKEKGVSDVVCAVSRFAGALTAIAVADGRKLRSCVKRTLVSGKGTSDQDVGKSKRVRSSKKISAPAKKKSVAVKKKSVAVKKKKKKASGQAQRKTTARATKTERSVAAKPRSAPQSLPSLSKDPTARVSEGKDSKPTTSTTSASASANPVLALKKVRGNYQR